MHGRSKLVRIVGPDRPPSGQLVDLVGQAGGEALLGLGPRQEDEGAVSGGRPASILKLEEAN